MLALGKLENLEMGGPEEDRPLVADLPFFSVCTASLLLPILTSLSLLSASFFIPPPFSEISTNHTVEVSRTGGFSFETELSNIDPTVRSVSLAIDFGEPLTAPCRTLLSLTRFSVGSAPKIQTAEHRATHATVFVIDSFFINATKVKAVVSFPVLPPVEVVVSRWGFANVFAGNFVAAAKLTLALLTIPAIMSIRAQLSRKSLKSLTEQQQLSFGLLLFSVLPQLPLTTLFGSPTADVVEGILSDVGFAVVAGHTILILLPFVAGDQACGFWGVGPPSCLFVLMAVPAILERVRRPPIRFFPPDGGDSGPNSFIGIVGAALLFCIYALVSGLRAPRSNRPRLIYFLAIGTSAMIGAGGYFALPVLGVAVVNSVFYRILPSVGLFLYANLMFHACQDTRAKSAFTALKETEALRDTSMGIELNDPLPLGLVDSD
jgi:hypothetical protein